MRIQFPSDKDLFNATAKEKKTKRGERNIKRKYNRGMQSKMVNTGIQLKLNDDLFCTIEKDEKTEKEMQKKTKFGDSVYTELRNSKFIIQNWENYETTRRKESLVETKGSMTLWE